MLETYADRFEQDAARICQQILITYTNAVTPDDGQRNCPKHVEFHSKNKFEKLVHLVGFILRNVSRYTIT